VGGGGGKGGGGKEVKVGACPQCSGRVPFTVNSEMSVYQNYQRMTMQEAPGSVSPGRLPWHREVILLWDLIDGAKPGEEVVRLSPTYSMPCESLADLTSRK
jgi:DNA replicative helicase MCM subunit Mcm2 (Cdc46/Mcm family)